MLKLAKNAILTGLMLAASTGAHANVTQVSSQSTFSSLGTIAQNTNFDSVTEDFTYPGNPYTVGALTFSSTSNLLVGNGEYGFQRTAIANDWWTPIVGSVDQSGYDLFGFNLGVGGIYDALTISVTTNVGTYAFNVALPPTSSAMSFFGFAADAGEYFQGFRLDSARSYGSLAGMTDIQLGTTGAPSNPVPEPSTVALVGLGLLGVSRMRRKAKQA
jgi:hypothetical protein